MGKELLRIENLVTRFHTEEGIVNAVDHSSFHVNEKQTLGIVGESGSGKTVTALSVMGLIENPGRIEKGSILFKGEELLKKEEKAMEKIRGNEIAMVFQDSLSSLNPVLTIGEQISRVIRSHTDLGKNSIRERAVELLKKVNIPEPEKRFQNYPHEMSGGMRQRILIAMAISCNPALLILDEPTTALDVTIEAQIFEIVDQLKEQFQMGTILITHDLSVVASSCAHVVIMYSGKVVEQADVFSLFDHPCHPYTKGLLKSIPKIDVKEETLFSIPGEVPDLITLPAGCNFAPRCIYAKPECWNNEPLLERIDNNRQVACLRHLEINE